jgi:tetratricopeptide (TPR) repeat protein
MLQIFSRPTLFDTIAKYALGAILLLLPILFSPVLGISTPSVKYILLYVCTAIATVAYLIARRADKKIILPNKISVGVLVAVPVVFLLSALFTGRFTQSFVGYGFEPTTVVSMLLFVTLAFLASVYARDEKVVAKALQLITISFVVVIGYQILRLALPANWLTLGAFNGTYANMLGKWNDIAIYVGMMLIAVFLSAKKLTKKALYIAIAISVVLLLLLNIVSFTLIWPVLILMALWIVLADSVQKNKITLFSKGGLTTYRLVAVVFAVVVAMYVFTATQSVRLNSTGNLLRPNLYAMVNFLPNAFGGTPNEVRPSALVTAQIFVKEVGSGAVFGSGPNRFTESWVQHRPVELFQTPYWNSDYAFGFGYLPTLAVTTGVLGLVSILALIGLLFWKIYKVTFSSTSSRADKIVGFSTGYLLLLSIVYVPATALLVYMFFGIGYILSLEKKSDMSLASKNMKLLILVKIVLTVIFFIFVGYLLAREYIAARYYVKSSLAISQERNIDSADSLLRMAINTKPNDLYYRAFADLSALKAQVILAEATKDGKELSTTDREAALSEITTAKRFADAAIANYPENYLNYLFAASVYESDPTQSEKTKDLYNRSMQLNPNNPDALFGIAKVNAAKNDIEGTREYIQKALDIRPLHTPALLAAAQLAAQDRDIDGSINLLLRAYRSDVSRVDVLIQVANIQLESKNDIQAATRTLEFAVGANPNSIDARYALSILYARQAKFEDAANLLVGVIALDAQTKNNLDPIIADLRAGKDPFTQGAPAAQAQAAPAAAPSQENTTEQ